MKTIPEMTTRELEGVLRERKKAQEITQANTSEEQATPDQCQESSNTEGKETFDPMTELLANITHVEKITDDMLETLAGQADNPECQEFCSLLLNVLSQKMQKLQSIISHH